MERVWCAIALAAVAPSLSFAQSPDDQTSGPTLPAPKLKSGLVATGLALGVTSAGIALGAVTESIDSDASSPASWIAYSMAYAALVAGPSAGHLYVGESRRFLAGTALRLVGLSAAVGGVYLVTEHDEGAGFASGLVLSVTGGATFIGALGWDLFDAHRAAARANQRASRGVVNRLQVTPVLHGAVGLQLSGAF